MSIGGTNEKVEANNKFVKKQYEYDKEMRDYNWTISQDNYEQAKQLRDIKVANDKQNVDYQNESAINRYNYQTQLQEDQYSDQVAAYNRSAEDYDTQKEFNQSAFDLAKTAEKTKRDEALIGNLFDKKTDKLNYLQKDTALQYEKAGQDLIKETAIATKKNDTAAINIQDEARKEIFKQTDKISDKQNNLLLDQKDQLANTKENEATKFDSQLTISDENTAQLQNQSALLTGLNLNNQAITTEKNSQLNTDIASIGLQKGNVDADISSIGLQKDSADADITLSQEKAALIESSQLKRGEITDKRVDSVNQAIAKLSSKSAAISSSDLQDASITQARKDILNSEANKIRAKKSMLNEQDAADLTIYEAQQGINQAEIDKNTASSDAADAQDIEDAGLSALQDQALGEQSEQALEQAGFLGGDAGRKYAQQANENIAKRMENYASQIRAKGAVAAQGRRGQSVDSQAQSALATYGRQQAQLVNSLVFASQDKSSSEQQLSSKSTYDQKQFLNERSKLTKQRSKQVTDKNLKKDLLSYDTKIKEQQSTIKAAERQKAVLAKQFEVSLADENLTGTEKQKLIADYERNKQLIDKELSSETISFEKDQRENDKSILKQENSISNNEAKARKAELEAQQTKLGIKKGILDNDSSKLTNQKSILGNNASKIESEKRINTLNQQKDDLSTTAKTNELGSKINQEQQKRNIINADRKEFNQQNALQKKELETASDINRLNKNISSFENQQQKQLNQNKKDGLYNALQATKEEVRLAKENITNRAGFNDQEWQNNQDVFEANNASAETAFTQAKNNLKLDKYAANLQALGNVMQPPSMPAPLPIPQEIPYTNIIHPSEPLKPPKPIKGSIGKTSVWNNISDGINTAASIVPFF